MTERYANIHRIYDIERIIYGAVWSRPLGGEQTPLLLLPDGAKVTPGEIWLDPDRWIFWAKIGKIYVALPDLVPTYGTDRDVLLIHLPGCSPIRYHSLSQHNPDGLPPEALPFWEQAKEHQKGSVVSGCAILEAVTRAWNDREVRKAAERLEVYGTGGLEIMQALATTEAWLADDAHIRCFGLGIHLPYNRRKTRASLLVGHHFARLCKQALTTGASSFKTELETALRPYDGKDQGFLWKNHEDNRKGLWGKAARLFLRIFSKPIPDLAVWQSEQAASVAHRAHRAKMNRAKAMHADSGTWGVGVAGAPNHDRLIGGKARAIHEARKLAALTLRPVVVTDSDGAVVYTTP